MSKQIKIQYDNDTYIVMSVYNYDIMCKNKEIERLKKGYCPIKEKCNKGECDCTNEEYNQMCEENIKLDLEIERLRSNL